MPLPKNLTFKSSLIFLILSIIIPILIIQAYFIFEVYRSRYNLELQSNLEIARAVSEIFERFVSDVLHQEAGIGHAIVVAKTLDLDKINSLLVKSKAEYKSVRDLSWISPNGEILACTQPSAIGLSLAKRSYFIKIQNGKDWVVGDLVYGIYTKDLVFTITRAFRDDSGAFMGAITAVIDDKHLEQEFSLVRPQGGGISIIDSKGYLVYRYPAIKANFEERNWLKTFPEIKVALNGVEYMGSAFAPFEGKRRVFATVPTSFGWVAAAGRTEDAITIPIYKAIIKRSIIVLSVILAGLTLPILFARRFSHSITKLKDFSESIGRREYDLNTRSFMVTEFQALADTFIKMASEVRLRNEQLEQKVIERTSELKEANQELDWRANKLKALASELTMVEHRVRKGVAKILHDHLQQILAAAKFRVQSLPECSYEELGQASKMLDSMLGEAISVSRSVTAQLSPPILFEGGLASGLDWLARLIDEKYKFKVELEVQEGLPELTDDLKIFLFESARELLFNSVKHSKAFAAMVTLRQTNKNSIQLIVADKGHGFDPKGLEFSDNSYDGYGLFSIIERIELFGGRIEIESGIGQGAQFCLTVPIELVPKTDNRKIDTSSIVQSKDTTEAKLPMQGVIRILIVDDHVVMREGVSQMLSKEPDIEVIGEAKDGVEAVALAQQLQPDVILMDISMPVMDGIEATRLIHQMSPKIKIVGLSMYPAEERGNALRLAGAIGFVSKSESRQQLLASIRASMQVPTTAGTNRS